MWGTWGETPQPTEQVGALWHWRRGDALPPLAPLPRGWRFSSCQADEADDTLIARLASTFNLSGHRSYERFKLGHRVAVGYLGDRLVAYGWVGVGSATFGEPVVAFHLPPESLYLYDFMTLAAWRGRGCYPALLQLILVTEPASDFWIIHHISNLASQRGIARAGFRLACAVYRTAAGGLALRPGDDLGRAEAGAALLGLPLLPDR